jgi:hypothetical protein
MSIVRYDSKMVPCVELPFEFAAPLLLRVLLGVGGAASLASALWCSLLVDSVDAWVAIIFLAFGVLDVVLWYFLSARIRLDAEGISLRRLGRTIRIRYEDVTRIEDRVASQRLIIHSWGKKIVVEKQVENYALFYSLLMELCPHRVSEERPTTFPIEVRVQRWAKVVYWLFPIAGGALLLLAILGSAGTDAAVFGSLLLGIGVVGFFVPCAYHFDRDSIEMVYLWRRKTFSSDDLLGIRLVRTRNMLIESSQLELTFTQGKVVLGEGVLDYPLELLASVLSQHYTSR